MNRKQLVILLAALVILGGAGLVLHKHSEESWNASGGKLGEKLLPNFPLNDVAALHIKGKEDLHIVHKNDLWMVKERDDYPANFTQVKELLLKMQDLKIAQAEPIGPSQLGRMQLAEPGSPDGATLVEFDDAQGKVLESLLLGKKHTEKSARPTPFGGGDFPDGRYVMLKSDPHDLLTVSDPLNTIDPKAAGWLNKDFFKVEKIKSIAFQSTNAADSWTLSRESESAPWALANPKPGEVLDTNKVSSVSTTLDYPSFVDVAADPSPAKTGLDKPLVVTITTFDHFTYVIKVGHKTPQSEYNMTVAVTADIPSARVASKDEKSDEKKKLDKEFEDKLKPLQDKLQQEKGLSRATYLVSSWLMDPLIRPRRELMVEKKDEKKSGDKKEAEAAPEDKSSAPVFPPPDSDK